jgi:hypothetical protein
VLADAVAELEVLVEHCAEGQRDGLWLISDGKWEGREGERALR